MQTPMNGAEYLWLVMLEPIQLLYRLPEGYYANSLTGTTQPRGGRTFNSQIRWGSAVMSDF